MTGALFISDDFHHLESCPRYVRTGQLGHGTPRRPEIIDDFGVYKWEEWHMCLTSSHFLVVIPFWYSIHRRVVKSKIGSLIREGPDARPSAYTPLGPLRRQQTGQIGLKWILKRCRHHILVFWNQASEINCQKINFRSQSQPSALSTTSHLLKAFQVNHDFHQWGSTTLQLSIWNILHLW